jgi:hypothetical protein
VLEGGLGILSVLLGQLSNLFSVLSFLEGKFLGESVLLSSGSLKGGSLSLELISNLFGDGIGLGLLFLGLSLGLSFSGMSLGNSGGSFGLGGFDSSGGFLRGSSGLGAHLGDGLGSSLLSLNNLLGVRDMHEGGLGLLVHLGVCSLDDFLSALSGLGSLDSGVDSVVDCLLGSVLHLGDGSLLGGLSRLNFNLGGSFDGVDGFDGVLKGLLESLGLLLGDMSGLLSLGSGTLQGSNDELDLLLDDLSLHLSNSGVLLVDGSLGLLFTVKTVHDSETSLEVVLVDLDLRKVGVHDLHGVLTGSGESHNVIPMLDVHLTVLSSELLLLDSDVRVLDTSPEESPSGKNLSTISGRPVVNTVEVTVPDDSLAGQELVLVLIEDPFSSEVGVGGELYSLLVSTYLSKFVGVFTFADILGQSGFHLVVKSLEFGVVGGVSTAGSGLNGRSSGASG